MILKRRDMKPIIRDMLLTMPLISELEWQKLRRAYDVKHFPIWKNLFKYVEREELVQLRADQMNLPLRTHKEKQNDIVFSVERIFHRKHTNVL